jgi:hypothetical protein
MMYGWSPSSLWHLLLSSASLTAIIGGIAVAIAILLPKQLDFITDLRKWAIVVAICAFGYTFVYDRGYAHGLKVKQAEWDAGLVKEADHATTDRSDAVRTVGPVPSDRRVFDNDPFNRNRGGKVLECGPKG